MKVILIAAVFILVGGAVWFLFEGKHSEENTGVQQMSPNTVTDTPPVTSKPSMIASLKDAMGLGSPLKCTYTMGTGQDSITSQVYVVGKKFKTEAMVGSVKTEALFDGDTQYVWTNGSTQGMKMSQSCLENIKSTIPEKDPSSEAIPQDYQQALDQAQNVKCEPVETDTTLLFMVPKEVTFTDQCAMMEQSKKMMDQVKGMVPSTYPGR